MLASWHLHPFAIRALAQAVDNAGRDAARRFWILGLPIPAPQFAVVPALVVLISPETWGLAIAAGIVAVLVGMFTWNTYLARVVDYLGRRLILRLSEAISAVDLELKGDSTSPTEA